MDRTSLTVGEIAAAASEYPEFQAALLPHAVAIYRLVVAVAPEIILVHLKEPPV